MIFAKWGRRYSPLVAWYFTSIFTKELVCLRTPLLMFGWKLRSRSRYSIRLESGVFISVWPTFFPNGEGDLAYRWNWEWTKPVEEERWTNTKP